jgi:CBS domain-containing protein
MLASRPVITVEADTLVIEALKMMSAQCISCVVVLRNDQPVGILTERDVVFAANWVIGQPSLRVREVMSKPVLTAPADLPLVEAYQLFREHRIRHLVVLGGQMEMDGIFTQTDLVRACRGSFFAKTADVTALMSSNVWCVTPQVTARHALSVMARHAISGVVVGEAAQPVGVFTERDVVRLVAADVDLTTLMVGAVMTKAVVTIPASASPSRAIDLMREHEVRRLLVVNESGMLAGVLTQTDLSRVLEHQEETVIDRFASMAAPFTFSPGLV